MDRPSDHFRTQIGIAVLMALCAATLAGCGRSATLVAVEGTLRSDGRPLENVLVAFLPDSSHGTTGPRSSGVTDAKGRYRLRTDDQRDGAVAGWHRVVLEDMAVYAAPRDEDAPPVTAPADRIPKAYCSAAKTPLSVEVLPGGSTHDLDLRRQ